MATPTDPGESLKRLGEGRWQTRDGRFTIEPQSGTWAVVDAEQTDELGLPLVRGPFPSLRTAKGAIAAARGSPPAASPLADRPAVAKAPSMPTKAMKPALPSMAKAPAAPLAPPKPEPPPEPRWLTGLEAGERRRARRLIDALADAGAADPEGIARRDVVGGQPAAAAFAVARVVAAFEPGAAPAEVAARLAGGRDPELGVRWRLVDGEGRPITLDASALAGAAAANRGSGRR